MVSNCIHIYIDFKNDSVIHQTSQDDEKLIIYSPSPVYKQKFTQNQIDTNTHVCFFFVLFSQKYLYDLS